MAIYKEQLNGGVMKNGSIFIPSDSSNRDWRRYMDWLAQGNVPDPADPPIVIDIGDRVQRELESSSTLESIVERIAEMEGVTVSSIVEDLKDKARGRPPRRVDR